MFKYRLQNLKSTYLSIPATVVMNKVYSSRNHTFNKYTSIATGCLEGLNNPYRQLVAKHSCDRGWKLQFSPLVNKIFFKKVFEFCELNWTTKIWGNAMFLKIFFVLD